MSEYSEGDFFYWKRVDELGFDVVRNVEERGVAVVTLLGYYDPLGELQAHIYPPFHGAYGNTFQSNSTNQIKACRCFVAVDNAKGDSILVVLKGRRMNKENMNRFQVNVPASFKPVVVSVHCNGEIVAQRDICGPKKKLSYTVNGRPL